ncbi:lycopene cyclase domain-containing protein [Corynebacterium yudongzhengii]|uniref:Lycopene cyclase domain-containing protein n=1 Tax=Corynebacterium yudongzhengii TaxID=2080740 RepID=A0A2U1T621_9CORY|nr:lycopene cyclase domain-containing protein [Corynebacterium yudongzhengii]AWB82008.1 lycopene cyclase domain-containing protein [Corynebacterium yudongzhengii]PWC01470.1 lycopene cyclase domain-containing protein [Corynebacterium yudongzhengii]
MGSFYLLSLIAVIGCMVLCDWRWKLAFFHDARRAAVISVVLVAAFLLWDVLGIATGTFYRGDATYMTGILLGPEMPIEEPIFLFFLVYLLLNLTMGARRVIA